MVYARGPGRTKIEIEGEGITVLLRNGELRVILTDSEGHSRVEKTRASFLHIETWTREIEEEYAPEEPPDVPGGGQAPPGHPRRARPR